MCLDGAKGSSFALLAFLLLFVCKIEKNNSNDCFSILIILRERTDGWKLMVSPKIWESRIKAILGGFEILNRSVQGRIIEEWKVGKRNKKVVG